jgi:hypothetical protein
MTRIQTFCSVIAVLALSVGGASAQYAGPHGGPPVIIRPPPLHLDSIPSHQQQQLIWGTQTSIQHRRDRLQAVPSGGTKTQ